MSKKTLLVVDDSPTALMMNTMLLGRQPYNIVSAKDGQEAVEKAIASPPDLVVMDVMMPRMNGIEAMRRIRAHSRIPVLMLTAKGDDIDRIVGLELGADDYVPKPCTPRELVARLRAILRRTGGAGHSGEAVDPLAVGPLTMWTRKRSARWRNGPLELTSAEYSLLEVLARNAGQVVGKPALSEQGLGRPLARFDRSIDVHMSNIRHKLGPRPDGQPWIQTVRGRGYQFVKD